MYPYRHHIIQFSCLMALLAAILLQGFTHLVKMKPLDGVVAEEKKTELCFNTYLDGSFQDYLAEHAKRNTGFREFFIRNYNQLCYSCFGRINNDNIVKGEDGDLFVKMYVDDLTGRRVVDYYGSIDSAKAVARENVALTLRLMDTLKQHGTDFLFVLAPSKAAVYPERLPKPYREHQSDFSLTDYYIELFKENHIPHIDFNSYFKSIKNSFPYPLYTQYGSHWAYATVPMVADSILRMMETVTGRELPSIETTDLNITTDYYGQDCELEGQLNLLFPIERAPLPNPRFVLTDTAGKDKPNLVAVGDSYFIVFENSSFLNAFDTWSFWKYNDDIISSEPKYNWTKVEFQPETHQILEDADIVMAIATPPMLYDYLFGFPDTAINLLSNEQPDEETVIKMTIRAIQNSPEWYEAVVKQAEELGITTEENLRRNAIYFIQAKETKCP